VKIEYDHAANIHTVAGAETAFRYVLAHVSPRSLVDVGCGTGTWLRAALRSGVPTVVGIDGVHVSDDLLCVPRQLVRVIDLKAEWCIREHFDVCLCLEVAEHLEEEYAHGLIERLTGLSDVIVFSAAIPHQHGEHHVNCQWPEYWQARFNERGYRCDDSIRWEMWSDRAIEPWYRQNMFMARKDPARAGTEPRLLPVVHPEIARHQVDRIFEHRCDAGLLPVAWYFRILVKAMFVKGRRLYERCAPGEGSATPEEQSRNDSR
jgi:hypothetical protein